MRRKSWSEKRFRERPMSSERRLKKKLIELRPQMTKAIGPNIPTSTWQDRVMSNLFKTGGASTLSTILRKWLKIEVSRLSVLVASALLP